MAQSTIANYNNIHSEKDFSDYFIEGAIGNKDRGRFLVLKSKDKEPSDCYPCLPEEVEYA